MYIHFIVHTQHLIERICDLHSHSVLKTQLARYPKKMVQKHRNMT